MQILLQIALWAVLSFIVVSTLRALLNASDFHSAWKQSGLEIDEFLESERLRG